MSKFKEITENMSFDELYDYLWLCPNDDDGFTWYKIDLLMQEIKGGQAVIDGVIL